MAQPAAFHLYSLDPPLVSLPVYPQGKAVPVNVLSRGLYGPGSSVDQSCHYYRYPLLFVGVCVYIFALDCSGPLWTY